MAHANSSFEYPGEDPSVGCTFHPWIRSLYLIDSDLIFFYKKKKKRSIMFISIKPKHATTIQLHNIIIVNEIEIYNLKSKTALPSQIKRECKNKEGKKRVKTL